jgi:RNA polymerase sigma-70 factor (ECF subfamily)
MIQYAHARAERLKNSASISVSYEMQDQAEAIERVYRLRYVGFRNALATVTGSDESARDAVQEGFARALAKRGQFRGGSLEAWIWRIALRCALDERRSPQRLTYDQLLDAIDPGLVQPDRDPDLAEAIRALPPRQRLIVFLRYFADLGYTEIAEACEVSKGTVAAALAHARAALLDALEPGGIPR